MRSDGNLKFYRQLLNLSSLPENRVEPIAPVPSEPAPEDSPASGSPNLTFVGDGWINTHCEALDIVEKPSKVDT